MASDISFVKYAVDQLAVLCDVSYKKMFGDYCVYFRGVPVLLICDNTAYIKISSATTAVLGDECEKGFLTTAQRKTTRWISTTQKLPPRLSARYTSKSKTIIDNTF